MSVIRLIITCITLCSQAGRLLLAEVLLQRFKSLLHRQALPQYSVSILLCSFNARSSIHMMVWRHVVPVTTFLTQQPIMCICQKTSPSWLWHRSRLPSFCAALQNTEQSAPFQCYLSNTTILHFHDNIGESVLPIIAPSPEGVNQWRLASTSHGSLRYLPPGLTSAMFTSEVAPQLGFLVFHHWETCEEDNPSRDSTTRVMSLWLFLNVMVGISWSEVSFLEVWV